MIHAAERALVSLLPHAVVGLGLRLALAIPFWRSGLARWDGFLVPSPTPVLLFENEFRLHIPGTALEYPFPSAAAWGSSIAELALPVLLVLGLFTRLAALGLLIMTGVIQLTVPSGWPVHATWAAMAAAIILLGPGRISLDGALRGGGARADGWLRRPAGGGDRGFRRRAIRRPLEEDAIGRGGDPLPRRGTSLRAAGSVAFRPRTPRPRGGPACGAAEHVPQPCGMETGTPPDDGT